METLYGIFSLPREPRTAWAPGQGRELEVPPGNKVLVTDVHIENLGGGSSVVELSEKRQPGAFEVRFAFTTDENQKLIINYTTGLLLGDEQPLYGAIKAENHSQSSADVLVRINGRLLP